MEPRLSLTGKRWILPPEGAFPAARLATELLARRRIEPLALTPGRALAGLLNPYAFPDMPAALRRIERAAETGERVGVFGDYDCDGVTSTAIVVRLLRRRGIEPTVRLPHRVRDGYGLTAKIVEEQAAAGTRLLIAVDTGISAHAEVAAAAEAGMDVLILDHHRLQGGAPAAAAACLHPDLIPDFADAPPSAAGVAFCLAYAMEGETWEGQDDDLALAAIGTVADLVPMRGGNRVLVHLGLRALGRLKMGPLAELAAGVAPSGAPTSQDIAYRIAPRINAAGRMDDPEIALRAVLEGGESIVALEALNKRRQEQTSLLLADALEMLGLSAGGPAEGLPPLLLTASERYEHGIIGLLAGKLTESYGRPSLVAAIHGDVCTASLRSPACYNIMDGLTRCAPLLSTFGGHAQAAGCTFALSSLERVREHLTAHVTHAVTTEDLVPTLRLDGVLRAQEVTLPFCAGLSALAPHGHGNDEPTFLVPGVRLDRARRVGGDGRHLQAAAGGCKAIGFGLGHLADYAGRCLDLACRVGIDTWNGRTSPQLFLEDVRLGDASAAMARPAARSVFA